MTKPVQPFENLTERFRAWVRSKEKLEARSLNDAVSRARRVQRYVEVRRVKSETEAALLLESVPGFREFSVTVRSQLRRAARLLWRFHEAERREER